MGTSHVFSLQILLFKCFSDLFVLSVRKCSFVFLLLQTFDHNIRAQNVTSRQLCHLQYYILKRSLVILNLYCIHDQRRLG